MIPLTMRIKKTLPLLVAAVVAMPAILNAQTSDRLPAASNASGQLRDSMPATWTLEPQYTQTTPTSDGWWNRFSDPTLQALMQRAVDNNFNVLAAAQRIEQARQTIRQTKAGYYPSFNIHAGWDKVQTSGLNDVVHVHTERDSYWHGDIGMNWEIDLFGRIRRQLKADKAGYKASLADYDAVLVSLCSDLASTYVDLRVAQQQLLLTEGTASEQDSLLNMAKLRYEAGLVSELDVVTARIMIKQTRATIPSLRAQIAADINAIAILVGEYPERLAALSAPAQLPPGAIVATGIPADLLRRRPDVVQAEQQLARCAAQVGVAKADFLPMLSLAGSVGTSAYEAKNLFTKDSFTWQITPTLSWTIFDGMGRSARIAEAKAQMMESYDAYNMAVMTAVQEVQNALSSLSAAVEEEHMYVDLNKEYASSLRLNIKRYREGLVDFSDVADAQIQKLDGLKEVVAARGNVLNGMVTLYTALGGGW